MYLSFILRYVYETCIVCDAAGSVVPLSRYTARPHDTRDQKQ
jgi:hypothetical protein